MEALAQGDLVPGEVEGGDGGPEDEGSAVHDGVGPARVARHGRRGLPPALIESGTEPAGALAAKHGSSDLEYEAQ